MNLYIVAYCWYFANQYVKTMEIKIDEMNLRNKGNMYVKFIS
jgi:hypothetical protein